MRSYSPVCVVTYNRPNHARLVIDALRRNTLSPQTDLYIFSDASKTKQDQDAVAQTRRYIQSVEGFKSVTVIGVDTNFGPAKMIDFVMKTMYEKAETFICVEDDVETHRYFLQYMNDVLDFYKFNEKVLVVSGFTHEIILRKVLKKYAHDVLFSHAFHAFAWGTWTRKIQKWHVGMTYDHKIFESFKERRKAIVMSWGHLRALKTAQKEGSELWDIQLSYYMFKNDQVCVWPRFSYARNYGFDGSGFHHYNFHYKWFVFPMNKAVLNQKFTYEIDLSRRLHSRISRVIAKKWTLAFWGNFMCVVKSKIRKFLHYLCKK